MRSPKMRSSVVISVVLSRAHALQIAMGSLFARGAPHIPTVRARFGNVPAELMITTVPVPMIDKAGLIMKSLG